MEAVLSAVVNVDSSNSSKFDDDAFYITATIKTCYLRDSYTVYLLSVSLTCRPTASWEVEKRFKEFCTLDEVIKNNLQWRVGTLPEKKWFGNTEREFVAKRQLMLEKYIAEVLNNRWLNTSPAVRSFFFPATYVADNKELADTSQQQTALILRSEPRFKFVRFLPSIGWRRRKCFGLAASSAPSPSGPDRLVVCWTEFTAKNACFEHEVASCLRWLQHSSAPGLLAPVAFASQTNRAVLSIQPLLAPALRDILACVEHPLDEPFLKKYSLGHKQRVNLSRGLSKDSFWTLVRSVVHQLVSFLAHFHAHGLFAMNIHAGNVVVSLKPEKTGYFKVWLLEAHSAVLGILPPYYMELLELGSGLVKTAFDADMAALGLLLKEMLACYRQHWQMATDVLAPQDLQPVVDRLVEPCSPLPTASELMQLLQGSQQPPMAAAEEVPWPGSEVVKAYTKARVCFEKRLSLHQAVLEQTNAVRHVRRSLATADAKTASPLSAATPHCSVLFAS